MRQTMIDNSGSMWIASVIGAVGFGFLALVWMVLEHSGKRPFQAGSPAFVLLASAAIRI
jgi:hypothetical protein